MAIDPEELKRRRAQRKLQREKKKHTLIVRLAIAGIVLVLAAILVIVLVSNRSDDNQKKPVEQSTQATAGEQTVIHLAAGGDLNINQAVVEAGGVNFDYTNAFMDVAHILAGADISAINFEGNLYGAPYGTDRSAPQELATALAKAGVDLVQLANSFSIYKGMEGLAGTINGIRLAGMEPLGVYADTNAAKAGKGYTITTVKGIKIAFVAFTKGMDGMALPAGNEGCVNVLYKDYSTDYQKVDTEGITKVLDDVAREKPDLTVAFLHWGSEFNNNISASQKEIRTLMQEKGVDAIIGTHSHYVQQMVYDRNAGTFVAYSLGDFVGDAQRAGTEYSVILNLEITKDHTTGQTSITNYNYVPIFTVVEEGKPLKVVRIREAMRAFEEGYIDRISQETYDAMAYAMKRIEARVNGE